MGIIINYIARIDVIVDERITILKDYIDIYRNGAVWDLSQAALKYLNNISVKSSIIILCIGTDRSTGDSLGPLVGYRLGRYHTLGARVVGNLEQPIHAGNLQETLTRLNNEIPDNFIVAVDACLGTFGHVGRIIIGEGPLRPGSGLKKDLPETGNMHITGIVNHCGWMDFMILQNTRLGLVMKMAEIIADGLQYALWKYYRFGNNSGNNSLNQYIQ
jgi:putative sporulation protein YyaC